jgi:Rrf2 family protein
MAVSRPTNTQFAIAVHVLTMLAGLPRELQSSEVMASSVGSNPVHIRRVLGRLRAAGLVASRPGPHGGWQLLRSPEETTLADVWRVVNGDDPVLGVHEADPNCPVGRLIQSNLEAIDRRALAAIEAELATTTLARLAADADPHPTDPSHLAKVAPIG